jgi:hypothetical protein
MSYKNIYSYKNNSNKNTKYDKDIISYLKRLGFPLSLERLQVEKSF